ncbi:MAG: penicillin-binding protein 1B [Gammaproteobacteria bacterium]
MFRPFKRTRRRRPAASSQISVMMWFQVIVIVVFCSAAYCLWLDHRMRTEFEGKRWSLPAQVYARPLELYGGLTLKRTALIKELQSLGYRESSKPSQPGDYKVLAGGLLLLSRSFQFWDGTEPSRKATLTFADNILSGIQDSRTRESIPLLRLEPLVIGKIYSEQHEDRVLVAYDDVPPVLVSALIAVEDRNFFSHFGLDPKGILRALWANLRSAEVTQGGSTLTQQLVKNFFLTPERSLWRKFNEMIMAVLLEMHYSKAEILSAYINEVYLGQRGTLGVHGFGTAAQYYYARPLKELRVDQIAMLVALVRGASYYNPRKYPERALARRNLILRQMQELKYLDQSVASRAMAAPLDISASPGWTGAKYPAFLELVQRQLQVDYKPEDLRSEGLRIFTTLDPAFQDVVEQQTNARLAKIEKQRNIPAGTLEAAGIISSTETGEILALLGGRYRNDVGFNRALAARRPIGSLIKPAIYLSALAQPHKYNVLTMLQDEAINLKQSDGTYWTPDNYDRTVHGDVPLYKALEQSYNLATVNLGMDLGMAPVRNTLKQLGVHEDIPDYPSVYLGAVELAPVQVAQMYQTLASNGFQIPLRSIREVLDKNGKPLQRYNLDIRQTLDSKAVFVTNFLLKNVVEQGTARSLSARVPQLLPLAGKTGTTNDLRDSWFAGFGDDILGVVWMGRDDNKSTGLTGASGALQLWTDIMQSLHPQPLSLSAPEGVSWMHVYGSNVVGEDCPGSTVFPFIEPYLPPVLNCPVSNPIQHRKDDNSWSIFNIFR